MSSRFWGGQAPNPMKIIGGSEQLVLPVGLSFFGIFRQTTRAGDTLAAFRSRSDFNHRQLACNVNVNAGGVASFLSARSGGGTIGAFLTIPLGVTGYIRATLGSDFVAAESNYSILDDNRSAGNQELTAFVEFDIIGL